MENDKWLGELMTAIDGHTAATLTEAEGILSQGFKPVDAFIAEVKLEVGKQKNQEQRGN